MKRLPIALLLAATLLYPQCPLGPDRDLGQILPGKKALRAVAIGDFGDPGNRVVQEAVSAAIAARHAQKPFDLGLTLGDNFYPRGVKSINDTKYWIDIWEQDYGWKLRIPFYASLGNHDYQGHEQAQVDYTGRCPAKYSECSRTWNLPCRYYTYAAGPVRFFVLDTDEGTSEGPFPGDWSPAPLAWLEAQLKKHADARWKVVYGHHPAFTDGNHFRQKRVRELRDKLVPLLDAHRVDAYLAGHDHDLQYRRVGKVHYPVIGGGGRNNSNRGRQTKTAEYYELLYGFLILEASATEFKLEIVGGKPSSGFSTRKRVPE